MTVLIAAPIDYSKPASHRARMQLLDVAEALEEAQASNRAKDIKIAYRAMEDALRPYLRTDDDTPVDDALAQVSGDQFIELYRVLVQGNETVGEAKSAP